MLCRSFCFLAVLLYCAACHAMTPVDPARLSELIRQADKIVVQESPEEGSKVLFRSTAAKDIAEFDYALTVVPPKDWFHCMCIGTPAVRLYRGGRELVLVTNHHGVSVRTSLWESDAVLKDPERWLKWFDARNIPEPRKEFEEMLARAKKEEVSYTRWLATMPKSIRPLWEKAVSNVLSPNIAPLRDALNKDVPNPKLRAVELFAWFGSGDGPWSGFPSYETIAEELLLDIPTPDLIAAIELNNLTDTHFEGAARLFGGWSFSQKRPGDRRLLPAALRKKLLEHALKSTDNDKLGRARNAFSEP